MFTIAHLSAAPGDTTHGLLPVVGQAADTLEIPLVLINGTALGPVLWVTAGIHGAEYPPIEAALRLAREVRPHDLCGVLIICPLVDPTAFFARSMYVCPVDHKNLNRVFPGQATGSLSERIASTLMHQIAPHVSHMIDLHAGDMVESLCPHIQAGDRVRTGQMLGEIRDYFGTVLETVVAPVAGKVLYCISSPAVTQDSLLMGIGQAVT